MVLHVNSIAHIQNLLIFLKTYLYHCYLSTLFKYKTFRSHSTAFQFCYILIYSDPSIIIPILSIASPINLHSSLYQQYLTLSILLRSYSIPSSLRTKLNSLSNVPIEISRFHSIQSLSFIQLDHQTSLVITIVITLFWLFLHMGTKDGFFLAVLTLITLVTTAEHAKNSFSLKGLDFSSDQRKNVFIRNSDNTVCNIVILPVML